MHLLVDVRFKIAHLLLNAGRQGGVVEAKSELDVAFLGAVREVRAAHQQEAVARVRMTTAPRSRRAISPVSRRDLPCR